MEQVLSPNRKLTVKRNLNDSFNNSSSSYLESCALNYSIIDNATDNETPFVVKLRKSRNQHLYVDIEKINSEILEQSLNNRKISINLKTLEKQKLNSVPDKTVNKVEHISSDDDKSDNNIQSKTEIVLRRSCRKKNRISYTDYLSPIKTPSKRNRKVSTDSDSSVVINTKTFKNSEYSTPENNCVCLFKHSKSKSSLRKLNDISIIKVETVVSSDDEIEIKKCSQKIPKASFVTNKMKDNYVKLEAPIKDKKVNDSYDNLLLKNSSPSKCSELQTPVKDRPKRISKPPARYYEEESPTKKKKGGEESVKCSNNCGYSRSIPSNSKLKMHDDFISPQKESNKLKAISNKNYTSRKIIHYKTDELHHISLNQQCELQTPVKNVQFLQKVQTPKSTTKNTPSMKPKLIREGIITPSVQMRSTPIKAATTPLNKARTKLHVSYMPKVLPCREKEYNDVLNFLEGKLLDGCGGCMYVSGVPGTGKTATVTDVIRKLEEKSKKGIVPSFQFISVNGMRLSEPRQSYVEIFKQLTGKTVFWEQAQSALDNQFTKLGKKSKPIIMLVDELDILCTKRQDVVYNLLDWPTKASVQLIVITIANTMDLPERLLMGRVTSRLGLTRLTFQAYTHKQLQEIVTMRLMGTKIFNPDAVQLVARKVASVSGDARRALDICRRAAEIAESESPNTLVSMAHVNEALNAMITQPKVKAIKHCSRIQQLILQAIASETERTGVEETTFSDVYTMFESIAVIDGFRTVSCTLALAAVSHLGACRLLLTDQKSNDFHQKLILNVSTDDVYYALRKD